MYREFLESRGKNTKPDPTKGTRNDSTSRKETAAAANAGDEDTDDEGHEEGHDDDDEEEAEQFYGASDLDLESSIEDVTPENDEAAAKA